MTPDVTVFVVDDDETVRDSLSWLLEGTGLNVRTYDCGEAFLDDYDPNMPGCLIVDLRMPGMNGLDVQKQLADRGFSIPIIFLTAYGTIPQAVRAMRRGAIDFVTKPFSDQTLLDRIEHAIELDQQTRSKQDHHSQIANRLALLTPREHEVMRRVIAGQSNKVIAAELDISQKTVEAHRAKVMRKMQADSLAELVQMVTPEIQDAT
ncbi:MAG: response regulator [Acidiferrobacterales bacterium]|nr:response regulator [Acidiferrobacterales bacterium]